MKNISEVFFQFWSIYLIIIMFINFFIILPIIFKFIIIPKIEKRIGEKLKYLMSIYRWQIFSSWFVPPADVGFTISIQYFIWKIKKRPPGKLWGYNENTNFALQRVNYDVRQASRLEISMSFLAMANMSIFIFLGSIALFFPQWV